MDLDYLNKLKERDPELERSNSQNNSKIQNQNEMMENDKYEILKFSLGKNSEIDNK